MQFHKTPIALAALAVCGAMPLSAEAAPSVSWTAPQDGAVLRGTISGSACAVSTSSTAVRTTFWANNWQINNDYGAPFTCNFNTTNLPDGAYPLRVRAYDSSGAYTERRINVTIANHTSTPTPPPPPANTAPSVSMTSPSSGASVNAGTSLAYAANAADDSGVARVQFFLDNASTPMLSDTSSPYGGTLNTTGLSGSHTIRAVAFDAAGLSSSSSVTFTVAATQSTGGTSTGGTTTGGTTTGGTTTGGTTTGGTTTGGTTTGGTTTGGTTTGGSTTTTGS
jgi:hypothetical protein